MSHRLRATAVAGGLVVIALAAFTLVWFQPQKLFIDERVAEPLPAAPPVERPATADARSAPARMVRTLAVARFRSHEHATRGDARLIELPDGRRYVRFERFRTSNGPVLRVYLSGAAADGPGGAFDDRFVDLGALKGNIGNQNYAIPRGTRLGGFRSVVIWCKRFSVPFGAAPLRLRDERL